MPHCAGYLSVAMATALRYDDTEERLHPLFSCLKYWRFSYQRKKANAFLALAEFLLR